MTPEPNSAATRPVDGGMEARIAGGGPVNGGAWASIRQIGAGQMADESIYGTWWTPDKPADRAQGNLVSQPPHASVLEVKDAPTSLDAAGSRLRSRSLSARWHDLAGLPCLTVGAQVRSWAVLSPLVGFMSAMRFHAYTSRIRSTGSSDAWNWMPRLQLFYPVRHPSKDPAPRSTAVPGQWSLRMEGGRR